MQAKDIITLVISGFALLVSVGSAVYTIFRGGEEERRAQLEERRTLRNLLTEAFKEMTSLTLEYIKLPSDARDNEAIRSVLNQQQVTLLDQSMYLAEQVASLVTPVEHNTLAAVNAGIGRMDQAEKYYLKAIDMSSPESNFKPGATRSYAMFLFSQRRLEAGRNQFSKALDLLTGSDNLSRQERGFTYQVWAVYERDFAHSQKRADPLFEDAENEFKGIDVEVIKQMALESLAHAKTVPQPPTQPASLLSTPRPQSTSQPSPGTPLMP